MVKNDVTKATKCNKNHWEYMQHLPNVDLMLGHRPRRWPNIKLTSGKHMVFAVKKDHCNISAVFTKYEFKDYVQNTKTSCQILVIIKLSLKTS